MALRWRTWLPGDFILFRPMERPVHLLSETLTWTHVTSTVDLNPVIGSEIVSIFTRRETKSRLTRCFYLSVSRRTRNKKQHTQVQGKTLHRNWIELIQAPRQFSDMFRLSSHFLLVTMNLFTASPSIHIHSHATTTCCKFRVASCLPYRRLCIHVCCEFMFILDSTTSSLLVVEYIIYNVFVCLFG